MINYGRQQVHGDLVNWVVGDASSLGTPEADLVLMTGNVAQVFLEDDIWLATLRSIHAALKVGGCVAFESLEVIEVKDSIVHMQGHNIFKDTGEILIIDSRLKFRSLTEITHSLESTGFSIEHVYGNWKHQAMTPESPVMIFLAKKN